ncbi:MAG: SDR family NAD(P)-dependent oxidoreductase, partial [Burkholderiaceae bacterium]
MQDHESPDHPPGPVVVLTGAAGGIGRATAHAFARRGARLALAARRPDAVQAVAEECAALGAEAVAVAADVTDAAAMRALADAAIARFGGIDLWVNNAGVGAVGLLDEVPLALHRRKVEANLLGHMHGAHVALAHFRARRRGTLVNMISLGGWVPAPYAAGYAASKFALRGFTAAMHAEVADLPDVHVCGVYPDFVDGHGAGAGERARRGSERRRAPRRIPDAQAVARAVVALLDAPRPTVMIGIGGASRWDGRLDEAPDRAEAADFPRGGPDRRSSPRTARLAVALAATALAAGALALR